jgi:hypothetical protein
MSVAVRRLLVVLAVAGAGFVPAPATAAGLCTGSGVNVVVDFGSLNGQLEKACGSGSTAAAVLRSAGISVTRVQSFQGAICQVEGRPDTNCYPMPPADAYWGLFWSDGTGHWVYSSIGVDGLKVPEGGFVGLAWQSSDSKRTPSVSPTTPRPAPAPTPTKQPSTGTTKHPGGSPTTAPRSGSPSASASAGGTTSPTPTSTTDATGSATPLAAGASPAPSTAVSPPASAGQAPTTDLTPADDDTGGGLAWWVPIAVLVGLAGGGGAAWWTRRRRTT